MLATFDINFGKKSLHYCRKNNPHHISKFIDESRALSVSDRENTTVVQTRLPPEKHLP